MCFCNVSFLLYKYAKFVVVTPPQISQLMTLSTRGVQQRKMKKKCITFDIPLPCGCSKPEQIHA